MIQFSLILLSYLIGSISASVIISKYKFGIDIRNYGSKNIGATNTFRVLGRKFGTIVLFCDLLKGILSTLLYFLVYKNTNHIEFMTSLGLASVLGHIFPIWHKFKGGKGVVTLLGSMIIVQPAITLVSLIYFLYCLYHTKIVSISSITSSIIFSILSLLVVDSLFFRVFSVFISCLIIIRHRKNILRIIKKEESEINF